MTTVEVAYSAAAQAVAAVEVPLHELALIPDANRYYALRRRCASHRRAQDDAKNRRPGNGRTE
jgi:hypothetical protein